jgi:hypothetical protein
MFNFLIVMNVLFSVLCVLFVCKRVLYYCHRVSTQLQLNIYIYIYQYINIVKKNTDLRSGSLINLVFIHCVRRCVNQVGYSPMFIHIMLHCRARLPKKRSHFMASCKMPYVLLISKLNEKSLKAIDLI